MSKLFLSLLLIPVLMSQSAEAQLTSRPVNYKEVVSRLEQVANKYPAQAQMFTMGINDQGEAIKGLQIGHGSMNSLVVATHHGNEYGSTVVALNFAEYLAAAPIADQTVYVIPVLNISGYNSNSRYERSPNNVLDANRDYPGPCVRGKTFALRSTSSLAQFLVDKNIVASATLHTFSPAVVYPWGISTHDLETPYENEYKMLVEAATVESKYQTGNNTEVMYAADGTFEDYAYWKHGIWSLLFEMGFSHSPDSQALYNMASANNPGLKRFLEKSPKARAANFAFTGKCDYSRTQRQRIFLE